MDEIRERNKKVDLLTREFLIDSTLVVAVFLIRAFEDRKEANKPPAVMVQAKERLDYSNATDFNDFWDEDFGEFKMGDYSYTASEILFNVDYNAYQNEHAVFVKSKLQTEELEEEKE